MTQEDGSRRYGVCLTTYYAPLPDHLIEELEILHKEWCESNMVFEILYCVFDMFLLIVVRITIYLLTQ